MSDAMPETPAPATSAGDEAAHGPELLAGIERKPLASRLWVYMRLSGPGWLQSAITLGSGSLASSLYLGVLGGFALLWLQPVAMILGVVMLSAIGYVALSTGQRPFRAVNEHVNPVLGWSWALATALANIVWCLPQFSVGTSVMRENLFPALIGPGAMSETGGKLVAAGAILAVCLFVIWFYDKGSRGIRVFERVLKIMVGIIIVCFFGVVIKMSLAGALDWGGVAGGLVPNFRLLSHPAATFGKFLADTGPYADYWKKLIVDNQRDVMISAFATAVGINMTFLLPYSMLAKGWRRNARGLAVFDLATGLFIPFILATGCVVISSAARFHTEYDAVLVGEAAGEMPPAKIVGQYKKQADARVRQEVGAEGFARLSDEEKAMRRDQLPLGDKRMAAMLVNRDAFNLAESLRPLTGAIFSHYVFGIGVIGMAVSSIIILMLISGFVVCEMIGVPPRGNAHRLACLLPCVGVLGPFIWTGGKAQFWLAMPTSVFCGALIPIAYWSFFCMMNSRSLLGESMPRGGRRVAWNVLMLIALAVVTPGSLWIFWNKSQVLFGSSWIGMGVVAAFLLLALIAHLGRRRRPLARE